MTVSRSRKRYLRRNLWLPGVVTGAMTATSFLFLLVALLVGCGASPAPPAGPALLVTSFSPVESQGLAGTTAALRIRFSAPVVAGAEVGRTLRSVPARVRPAIAVAASWSDRQTLVLRPTSPLRPSTRYQVTLARGIPGLVGKTRFWFVHRPIAVQRLSGLDPQWVSPRPAMILHFNQPVLAGEVARGCSLLSSGRGKPRRLRTPDREMVASAVHLTPVAALQQGRSYTLRCAELRGHRGDAVLPRPYVRRLRTYPQFSVLSFGPRSRRLPSDEVPLTLRFSTPVTLAAVRRAITIHPWARGARRGTLDSGRTRYTALVNLKLTTRYTVRLSGRLTDVHGQRLGRGLRYAFTTSDASPRMTLERGIYTVEPSREGYPVWTRNIRSFQVECARVPQRSIVGLLTSTMNYDPWYASSSSRGIHWRKLGLRRQRRELRIARAKNKWRLTHLELHSLCSDKPGRRGLFLAELRSRDLLPDDRGYRYRPRQRVLANVTDLGVLLKVGPASGLVWVTGISHGKPVPGATVTIFDLRGRRLFRGTSDGQGLVRLPGTNRLLRQPGAHQKNSLEGAAQPDDYDIYRSQRLIVTARKGHDLAVVDGNWSNGIQIWNFGVPVDRSGGRTRIRGLIQSDRGVYRPGEKVHFKGLVREVLVGRPPRVPGRAGVKVHVEDSRGSVIFRRRLRLSSFGGFAFDLALARQASVGDYHVSATVSGQTFRERFVVEEFRKVAYEVKFAGHERHTRGRKQQMALTARYLFGAPVKRARVAWSVQRRAHRLRSPRFPGYTFTDNAARGRYFWWDRERGSHPGFVTEGRGDTGAQGRYLFSFGDNTSALRGPQDYLVQATVTDESDQSVSRRVVRTVHSTEFYLGLHAQEYVQAVDMPFAINTAAMAPGGKQVAARATLSLIRERHDCSQIRSGGHRVHRKCKRRHHKLWSRAVRIPATGNGVERILPKQPGEYVVRLEGRDSRGRRVAASTYVWIIGKGQAFWSGDESARLSLVASRRVYSAGEKAKLVPRANMAGATALVTLERGGVLDAFVTSLQTSGSGIEVPLEARHAPNVFASVALVRGRSGDGDAGRPRFKMGVLELSVSPDSQRLNVRVTTEQPSYEPGQQVSGLLSVTDSSGKPVRAEVSLSAADEGVLQLVAYQTPDPVRRFYKPFGLGIDSSTNWNRIARLNDPLVTDPDEGGDSGGVSRGKVRSRFVNSAFWAPGLITNGQGEVRFAFKAPDNLTAFRLMAVAADSGSRFGSGQQRFTVRKPLLARAVLPRLMSAGDRVQLGVVVHNHTGRGGLVTVQAHAQGVTLERQRQRVRVRAGGAERVSFWGRVGSVDSAQLRFVVRKGDHHDALVQTLPVQRPLSLERSTVAQGTLNGKRSVPLKWPADLLASHSRLELSLDRTGLSRLGPGLRYLIRYPYGCLEQTLSGFIPLTRVKDLARSLKLPELRGPRLRAFTLAGVAKVLRHQHSSGQFSLWPGSQPYPHLTVYAMYGLNQARRAGIAVDPRSLKRGVDAVRSWVHGSGRSLTPGGEIATMAMAAQVLAELGHADPGLNARLYEARGALPRYGQAFLLRAMHRANGPAAQIATLKKQLLSAAQRSGEVAMIRESSRGRQSFDGLHWYMSSDVRTSAMALSALLELDPRHRLVAPLARGLLAARRADGRWYNTQDNLYSLVALSDLARRRARGSSTVTVSLGGRRLLRSRLRGSRVLALSLPLDRLQPGQLTIQTRGKLRYTIRLVQARAVQHDRAADNGFGLTRQYLDPATGQPLGAFAAGQLVKVRLTLRASQRRTYVALVDPLPAGLEPVNTRLATTLRRPTPAASRSWSALRARAAWSHKELRDDQARFFADRLPAGSHTLEYRARATIRGSFTAAPARVESMYEPDINGRSTAAKVEVR